MPTETPTAGNDLIRLDSGEGEELILIQIAPAHVEEIDAALGEIQAGFVEEQKAGLPTLEKRWRAWTVSHEQTQTIEETIALAERARRDFDAFLLLGIGGSDLAPRVIHDSLDHPWHNLLSAEERGGAPEVYFAGDTFDPRRLHATLSVLKDRGLLPRTLVNVISRSGTTAETLASAMIAREWLTDVGVEDWRKNVVATTQLNEKSALFRLGKADDGDDIAFYGMLPVPDGVGGRFSLASPVGLFTLALTTNENLISPRDRVLHALAGYGLAHRRCCAVNPGERDDTAVRLARWLHLAEAYAHKTSLVFYNSADDRLLADWLAQLYIESVQERGRGLNLIEMRGPTGNHSILNGIIRGPRDKVVVFVQWERLEPDLRVPEDTGLAGELGGLEQLPLSRIQQASYRGTAADLTANGVPNVTLIVPGRDEAALFQLMRILMDTVAVKGKLQLLHCTASGQLNYDRELTYQQDGVEGYKQRMREELADLRKQLGLP